MPRAAIARTIATSSSRRRRVGSPPVAGRLVPVLTEWELSRLTMNIAYPTRRHLPAKVRAFVDFLVEQFEAQEFERRWNG
jgi:DNA-binding transcriptional LysR family regulator